MLMPAIASCTRKRSGCRCTPGPCALHPWSWASFDRGVAVSVAVPIPELDPSDLQVRGTPCMEVHTYPSSSCPQPSLSHARRGAGGKGRDGREYVWAAT